LIAEFSNVFPDTAGILALFSCSKTDFQRVSMTGTQIYVILDSTLFPCHILFYFLRGFLKKNPPAELMKGSIEALPARRRTSDNLKFGGFL
jgi:hypothetical protein